MELEGKLKPAIWRKLEDELLIYEIIPRVPLFYRVTKFRAVCKGWRKLMESEEYLKYCESRSVSSVLITVERRCTGEEICWMYESATQARVRLRRTLIPVCGADNGRDYQPVASSGGLVCFWNSKGYNDALDALAVCNPLLNQWLDLPLPPYHPIYLRPRAPRDAFSLFSKDTESGFFLYAYVYTFIGPDHYIFDSDDLAWHRLPHLPTFHRFPHLPTLNAFARLIMHNILYILNAHNSSFASYSFLSYDLKLRTTTLLPEPQNVNIKHQSYLCELDGSILLVGVMEGVALEYGLWTFDIGSSQWSFLRSIGHAPRFTSNSRPVIAKDDKQIYFYTCGWIDAFSIEQNSWKLVDTCIDTTIIIGGFTFKPTFHKLTS